MAAGHRETFVRLNRLRLLPCGSIFSWWHIAMVASFTMAAHHPEQLAVGAPSLGVAVCSRQIEGTPQRRTVLICVRFKWGGPCVLWWRCTLCVAAAVWL